MATHSSILAWRIPWTEEPCGLQSMGSQRVGHDLATKPPPPRSFVKCNLHLNNFHPKCSVGVSLLSWSINIANEKLSVSLVIFFFFGVCEC